MAVEEQSKIEDIREIWALIFAVIAVELGLFVLRAFALEESALKLLLIVIYLVNILINVIKHNLFQKGKKIPSKNAIF